MENPNRSLNPYESDDRPSLPPILGYDRTTFAQDLTHLHQYISSIADLRAAGEDCSASIEQIKAEPIFGVVLERYDPRRPADFEEMKDTAWLREKTFRDLRDELCSGWETEEEESEEEGEGGKSEENSPFPLGKSEEGDAFAWKLDQLIGLMSVIEGMRDHGMPAPKFWIGDAVTLTQEAEMRSTAKAEEEKAKKEGKEVEGGWVNVGDEYDGGGEGGRERDVGK